MKLVFPLKLPVVGGKNKGQQISPKNDLIYVDLNFLFKEKRKFKKLDSCREYCVRINCLITCSTESPEGRESTFPGMVRQSISMQ